MILAAFFVVGIVVMLRATWYHYQYNRKKFVSLSLVKIKAAFNRYANETNESGATTAVATTAVTITVGDKTRTAAVFDDSTSQWVRDRLSELSAKTKWTIRAGKDIHTRALYPPPLYIGVILIPLCLYGLVAAGKWATQGVKDLRFQLAKPYKNAECDGEPGVANARCDGKQDPISWEVIGPGMGTCLRGRCYDKSTLQTVVRNRAVDPFSNTELTAGEVSRINA